MKAIKFKVMTYLVLALFAGYVTTSCEACDEGNNFEDQESAIVIDTLSVE